MNNTSKEFNLIYFYNLAPNKRPGFLRHWLSDDDNEKLFTTGQNENQLWMVFARMGEWECVNKIIEHEKSDINARDENNRGWLHYAIYHAMPDSLAIKGISMLNNSWNEKDKFGNEPMEIFPSPQLAHEMARKLWTEINYNNFIKKIKALKKDCLNSNNEELKRVWDFWLLK